MRRPARLERGRAGRRGAPPTQTQAEAQAESEAAMKQPSPRSAAPPPRADDRLAHAPRPVLAPHARPLRRRLHAPRRAARSVGDARPSRPRQAGLHRRPERAARGRGQRILKPLLGPRSVLLLDGTRAHAATARLLLPPFHGERMQAYGEHDPRDRRRREVASWPRRRAARHPPAHAGAHARDHHARRLRLPRRAPARGAAARCSSSIGGPRTLVLSVLGGQRADQRPRFDRVRAPVDALLGELIAAPPRRPRPRRARRHPLAAAGRHATWTTRRCATSC